MNYSVTTKLAKGVAFFIVLACIAIFVLYLVQKFGSNYAEEKIQQRIRNAGLTHLIHYERLHLDPFTLTPSLEEVRIGPASAPWFYLARISFNSYLFKKPNLDVNFWIKETPVNQLAASSASLLRHAGLQTLLGKGHFRSQVDGDEVTSQLHLDIKDLGKWNLTSDSLVDQSPLNLTEVRTDLLASIALGQPEAVLIIYGDKLKLEEAQLSFDNAGLYQHLLQAWQTPDLALLSLQNHIAQWGLAPANSRTARQMAQGLYQLIEQDQSLAVTLQPADPISLKEWVLLTGEKGVAESTNMAISQHQN
ncbi:hypothetical protein [Marinomonas sp. THO17]|uniref:hypothetical protein n=1 Tax=Marinomonas sp. THO17 TaxID=3149048 RepID=UPI00336C2AD9